MSMEGKYEEIPVHKFFLIRPANEWMAMTRGLPIQKKLFGDFWFENELAVLFAETNAGKSILAVQIADSISRGIPICPLEMTAPRQKVGYFDFELNDRQFSIRYTVQGEDGYVWDNNFYRVVLDPDAEYPEGDYSQYICDQIEVTLNTVGAKVGIVDNITFFSDELEKSKAALPLMKQLKRIKEKYDFSLLILAHTPKRDSSRPICKNDIQGSKMIMNFIDSAFAIGESRRGEHIRYLKMLKTRNAEREYGRGSVLCCEIRKEYNFLHFEITGTAKETEHLDAKDPMAHEQLLETIREGIPNGKSARAIAEETGVSHTTINRLVREMRASGELPQTGTGNLRGVPDVPDVPPLSGGN